MEVLLLAMLVVGVSAEDACWEEKKNMYMSCFAADDDTQGSLDEMQKKCIDLEDACLGVTCSKEQKCSMRHHRREGCEGGKFLDESKVEETTYVKVCKVNEHKWDIYPHKYIPCYAKDDQEVGELLERKIRCSEMGDECVGVTCGSKDGGTTTFNCTVRDHTAGCKGGLADPLADSEDEVSFVMDPIVFPTTIPATNAPPIGESCRFEVHDKSSFTCNPPDVNAKRMTLKEAQQQCVTMKDPQQGGFCNGVECTSWDGELETCLPHMHCVAEGQQMLKVSTSVVHIKKCSDGKFCTDPCNAKEEFKNHVCENDCDCGGVRYCSESGYCKNPTGLSPFEELCITDHDCIFEKHTNKYMKCEASASTGKDKMTLEEAQKVCKEMKGLCAAVTCVKNECSLRNHMLDTCNEPHGLFFNQGEDTYLKCCGPEKEKRCPGGTSSGSSNGHTGFLVFLVICLIAGVAVLAYWNRQMAKDYIAPNTFNAVPQDEEADNNWVIDDTKEDDE
eukprot:TRINITY_DN3393_c0_g7_i1.p1 TRINITY_DN3393_c0_g7~~TRINITY_DN3393_c0_g7_i1.p1  ORF type:complete len:523 (+),score=151.96 TRINITY_DN3393_c0_g7_i1:63-1571(+)